MLPILLVVNLFLWQTLAVAYPAKSGFLGRKEYEAYQQDGDWMVKTAGYMYGIQPLLRVSVDAKRGLMQVLYAVNQWDRTPKPLALSDMLMGLWVEMERLPPETLRYLRVNHVSDKDTLADIHAVRDMRKIPKDLAQFDIEPSSGILGIESWIFLLNTMVGRTAESLALRVKKVVTRFTFIKGNRGKYPSYHCLVTLGDISSLDG